MAEEFHLTPFEPEDLDWTELKPVIYYDYDPFDIHFTESAKAMFQQHVKAFSTLRNSKCDLIWDKLKSKVRKTDWCLFDNACLLRNDEFICVLGVLPHMRPAYMDKRYDFEQLLSSHCRSGYMEITFLPLDNVESVQKQMAEYEKSPPETDEDLDYLRIQYSHPGTEEFFLKKSKYYDPVNGWVKSHEERPHVRLRMALDDIPF